MKYRLLVRPEVDADLLEAEAWYEDQAAGLGRDFLRAVYEAMECLPLNPLLFRVRYRRKMIRWAYPSRFPYRIVFGVMGDEVVIYAVIHAGRHDRHWKRRV